MQVDRFLGLGAVKFFPPWLSNTGAVASEIKKELDAINTALAVRLQEQVPGTCGTFFLIHDRCCFIAVYLLSLRPWITVTCGATHYMHAAGLFAEAKDVEGYTCVLIGVDSVALNADRARAYAQMVRKTADALQPSRQVLCPFIAHFTSC